LVELLSNKQPINSAIEFYAKRRVKILIFRL